MRTSPLHVLWIEDSSDDVELFSMALKRTEVKIHLEVKVDGQEGIDHLMALAPDSGAQPDLILLDLNLPKRHGSEVLAEIKNSESLRLIPVVVLTTSNFEPDIVKCYHLGAACYLVKPDQYENLVNLIKKIFAFWQEVELRPRTR